MNRQESLFNGLITLDDATSFILESEVEPGSGPEGLQAAGVDVDFRSKVVLFAA